MAMLFMDSFDHYLIAEIPRKWNSAMAGSGDSSTITSVGRNSTNGLKMAATNGCTQRWSKSVPASGATCIVQMALKVVSAFTNYTAGSGNTENTNAAQGSSATSTILSIRQGGTTHVWFSINQSGQIVAWRGTTTLGTSSALTQGTYHYLKIKVVINNSTGTIDILKDGSSILSLSSQDTQNTASATWDEICMGHIASAVGGTETDIDDLLIMDGSGSYNNAFINDRRISALYPNAVGNSNGSTPSSGGADRYTMVDETSPNDDTDYNTFAATGDKDTYGCQNCPTSGADVAAVAFNFRMRKADAGEAGGCVVGRISGTDYDGTTVGVPSSYANVQVVNERSLVDGTTQWTTTVIDGAEFGFKKAS